MILPRLRSIHAHGAFVGSELLRTEHRGFAKNRDATSTRKR
jgi:hypothetical protein